MIFAVAFFVSFLCGLLIILTKGLHGRVTLDRDISGIRRFHIQPVPRVGGISLLVGLAAGGIYHGLQADNELYLIKWAGVANRNFYEKKIVSLLRRIQVPILGYYNWELVLKKL